MDNYRQHLAWRSSALRKTDGILVGSDISQEWLLPWWWANYQKHNAAPVAFADFGMSSASKEWCRERGELLPLRLLDDFVKERKETIPFAIKIFEKHFGKDSWESRATLFKKPFACLQTPFRRTLWLDIDCEILRSIQPLFAYADEVPGFGIVKDKVSKFTPYPVYNSGVFVYRRNLELITQWAQACLEQTGSFPTDDHVLAYKIATENIAISEIPAQYNWFYSYGAASDLAVIHWLGSKGKNMIRLQMSHSQFSTTFPDRHESYT